MSKDIFKTKSFLFFSAFIFLILAILVVLIVREDPDISELGGSPAALFSLNRNGPDGQDNPFVRPDGDNLPVTTINSGDPGVEEAEHRPGTLVQDVGSGQGVFTEAPNEAPAETDQPADTPAEAGPEPDPASAADTPASGSEQPAGSDQGQTVPEVIAQPVDPTGLSIPSSRPEGAVLASADQDTIDGNVTTKVELAVGNTEAVLRIEANNPISARSFVLTDPERVVLDLQGSWKVQLPEVPANNLVGAMRQGIQPEATRLVLDMREKTQSVVLNQLGTQVIELHIQ